MFGNLCWKLCLNLNDYQVKTSIHIYRSTHMNFMIITNQKVTIDTQKLERKEHKHKKSFNQKKRHKRKNRRTEKNYKNNQKTSHKMAISKYLSIITLNDLMNEKKADVAKLM